MRAISLARSARRRLKLEPPILDASGTLDAGDTAAARRVAARFNESAPPVAVDGTVDTAPDARVDPAARPVGHHAPHEPTALPAERSIGAGELVALAALGAVLHEVVESERRAGAADLGGAIRRAESAVGPGPTRTVAGAWAREFAIAPKPADEEVVGELLVLAALNDNPAVDPVRELVDDRPLRRTTRYEAVVSELEDALGGREPKAGRARAAVAGRAGGRVPALALPAQLREPMRHAPGSLQAQLRWVRDNWSDLLLRDPALAERVALAIDVLAEEARALELAAAAAARAAAFGGPVAAEAPDYHGLDAEPEAFSPDTDWMPSVVLVAKSTYVWLEQLSARHGRWIRTLADVPDEELDAIAGHGITGLWLIGLWQRSAASAEIKRRRGDRDAVASAYSIDEYRIADDLGGEAAYESLRARAAARGIRMAADMVPNHMGLDSRWVIDHPERFISLSEPPFPAYSFSGPDLSPDPDVEITIEDHYWDASDAAVVFRRRQRGGPRAGDERFIYHGNDGTSFPWNDTAQLDYLRADVREAVIRTILDVARRAPIIRFDAAMVLARRHIRRLWYPRPGEGGAIPSRAEHAMSDAEFNARMPTEFWRDVVDRVAAEAPGTLLLAEAFWLLEGYFVRTLGMHRVYNSAFMHMLREEDNAAYRRVMKDTLEFDPRVLQRFVNFMTNPDERPAAEQYGTGDKAFAVATLLATLPGLPMLGHGQVEGLRERYGHEFRRARWDEPIDRPHLEHWERTIVPLLRRRAEFSGTEAFHLYDATSDDGSVVEDVYAFSNRGESGRSLVLVHNRHADVDITVDHSVAARRIGARLARTRLARDLDLDLDRIDPSRRIRFRDPRSGWEQVRTVAELRERGLHLHLGPYEARVAQVDLLPELEAIHAAPREAASTRDAAPSREAAPTSAPGARRRARPAESQPARRPKKPSRSRNAPPTPPLRKRPKPDE